MNEIKFMLKKQGFQTRKSWGQNFIYDDTLLEAIAEDCDGICLEIGSGPGGLTRKLAETCDKVIAIEIDPKLSKFLTETLVEYDNIEVINKDFMKLDLDNLYKDKINQPFIVAANLPYYITTPIMMQLLDSNLPIKQMRLMVQKEVAQRIVSDPGSKDYGVLSLMVQCRADASMVFDVPAHMFSPPPNVTSTLISINISPTPKIKSDINDFRACVRSGFSSRRKQLVNNISKTYSMEKPIVKKILTDLNLAIDIRAERLSVFDFDNLTQVIKEYKVLE